MCSSYVLQFLVQHPDPLRCYGEQCMITLILFCKMVNLGKRKPKMRVTYKRPETDYEYNARKHRETVDLDAILDKLKRSGYESLSAEEKKKLFDASKK